MSPIPSLGPGVLYSWHKRIFDLFFFHSRLALYALMAVLSVVVLIGHHNVPPLDRDEARFAQASKQMLQTGIISRFGFKMNYVPKPAGIYWLQSTFANFLGADDISSHRFVNLLALLAWFLRFTIWRYSLMTPRCVCSSSAILQRVSGSWRSPHCQN